MSWVFQTFSAIINIFLTHWWVTHKHRKCVINMVWLCHNLEIGKASDDYNCVFKQSYVQAPWPNIVHFACQQNPDTLWHCICSIRPHTYNIAFASPVQCTGDAKAILYVFTVYIWSIESQTWFGNHRIDVFWSVRYKKLFNSHVKCQGGLLKEIDQSEPFGGSN